MAEQATADSDNKPKASANGLDKTSGQKITPEGRKKISDAQKANHAAKLRDTTPVTEDKIERLHALVNGGATVKEASELLGMGYSTAQRYMHAKKSPAGKKSSRVDVKKANGHNGRLSPEQTKLLNRLLPKLGSKLKADEIAERVGCHVASVYFYRKKMLAEADPAPAAVAESQPQQGISATHYANLRLVYKKIWQNCWAKQVEATDAELDFIHEWRQMR